MTLWVKQDPSSDSSAFLGVGMNTGGMRRISFHSGAFEAGELGHRNTANRCPTRRCATTETSSRAPEGYTGRIAPQPTAQANLTKPD